MLWRVEVREKEGYYDALGESVKKDIADLGFKNRVKEVNAVQVYLLEGRISESDIKFICQTIKNVISS